MWEEMGWDEKSWDEVRRAHVIWDEMGVKSAVWSVKKCFLHVALHRGRVRVMFLDNNTATASHKARTYGPGWCTAHASSLVVVWEVIHESLDDIWEGMSRDKVRRAQMRWSVECEECSVKCGGVKIAVWSVEWEVWSVKKAVRSEKCEVWTVKCEVWSVQKAVRSEKCVVCSVKCGVLRVQCEVKCGVRRLQSQVGSVECEVCSVECEDCSDKCEVRSGALNVTCETKHQFGRVHARTGLAGARRTQVL